MGNEQDYIQSDTGYDDQCSVCSGSGTPAEKALLPDRHLFKLLRLTAGVIFLAAALFGGADHFWQLFFYLTAYGILGYNVIWRALQRLARKKLWDEHFLMSLATLGALFLGEYPEAVAVMLFYQVGEFFQGKAVDHSRRSIAALQQLKPDQARKLDGDNVTLCRPEAIKPGSRILVLPGDRVPLDGFVSEGQSEMDTAAMTGESLPRRVEEGSEVLAGFINGSGRIILQTTKEAGESAVHRVLELVQSASARKARTERMISRFASVYTPLVVFMAFLLATLPPLALQQPFGPWIYRALVLLVISCPCALVLSVPLTFFAGLGAASRKGLLIKGGSYLEKLARADAVVFDKTGTLTEGELQVDSIQAVSGSELDLLKMAAAVESYSTHPVARSLIRACRDAGLDPGSEAVHDVRDIPGLGMSAWVGNREILLGNRRLFEKNGIRLPACHIAEGSEQVQIYMAADGQYAGCIALADRIRPEAAKTLQQLRRIGIRRLILLSGDRQAAVSRVAGQLDIDLAYGELLPSEKVSRLESLSRDSVQGMIYLGDGINDAPVLARADLGIAMGSGSDAALESADAVLLSGSLHQLPDLIEGARKTMRIVRQNIFLALALKLLIMGLAVFGLSGIWQAIFADVGVSLLAVLNAMRLIRRSKPVKALRQSLPLNRRHLFTACRFDKGSR